MTRFEPANYSVSELKFFHEHMGESPVVALSTDLPKGVNPVAVKEVLGKIYELEELQKHRGFSWVGIDAMKDTIEKYLEMYQRDLDLHRAGAPRYSSMHMWDGANRPHRGGIGSDSDFVRTYIDDDGSRVPLGIDMEGGKKAPMAKLPWAKAPIDPPRDLIDDTDHGIVSCPLCGFSQNYQIASPGSRNVARARVGKHCKSYTGPDADAHRALYTTIFG